MERVNNSNFIPDPDIVELYLKDACNVPLLTAEQEIGLAKLKDLGLGAKKRIENGDFLDPDEYQRLLITIEQGKKAGESIAAANTRLVVSVAKKYQGRGIPFLDLIQEGNIGLLTAVEKYDYKKARFSTYATWWIRQAITIAIYNQGRTISLPVEIENQLAKMQKIEQDLKQKLERDPTDLEIAEALGVRESKIRRLKSYQEPLSIDAETGEFGRSLEETLETPDETVEDQAERASLIKHLTGCLKEILPERQAQIIIEHFGLDGREVSSLEKIGKSLGITKERVRQLEQKALKGLRSAYITASWGSSLKTDKDYE